MHSVEEVLCCLDEIVRMEQLLINSAELFDTTGVFAFESPSGVRGGW